MWFVSYIPEIQKNAHWWQLFAVIFLFFSLLVNVCFGFKIEFQSRMFAFPMQKYLLPNCRYFFFGFYWSSILCQKKKRIGDVFFLNGLNCYICNQYNKICIPKSFWLKIFLRCPLKFRRIPPDSNRSRRFLRRFFFSENSPVRYAHFIIMFVSTKPSWRSLKLEKEDVFWILN